MRTEATLEQWKELYELALEIKALEPWNYFADVDLIAIHLEDEAETVYCSIMGQGGDCYGIGCYVGQSGLEDFDCIARCEELELPIEYVMMDQSNLTFYLGGREEVPPEQKKIIKELGYRFRGEGNWLYFVSYRKGYMPYQLDRNEVLLLTEVYKNLIMAVSAVLNDGLSIHFEKGEYLNRSYDKKNKQWLNYGAPLPPVQKMYSKIELSNEVQKMMLKKKKRIPVDFAMDLAYLNVYTYEDGYDRPINPLLFLAVDVQSGAVVAMNMLKPDDDPIGAILNFFGNFVEQHGRMHSVTARNLVVLGALEDICQYLGIELLLEGAGMEQMDEVLWKLRQHI